jgi:hypothetical protein
LAEILAVAKENERIHSGECRVIDLAKSEFAEWASKLKGLNG